MRVTTGQYDYRLSHLAPAKGQSYDASFIRNPWRAFVWQRERLVLDRVLQKHYAKYAKTTIDHLDFACGTGRVLEYLSSRVRISVGVDVSDAMLDVARRKTPKAELIQADITRADVLRGRSFNLITAFRFFPNAQSELRHKALQVLAGHLAPQGLLVFNNHKNRSSCLYRLGRFLGKHPRTMSCEEVNDLLLAAGLEIAETHAIGVLPATDNHMVVPRWAHRLSDCGANALGLGRVLAQNLILVCKRTGTHALKSNT